MRWDHHRQVRIHTYDTADWLLLSWSARCLMLQLLRKAGEDAWIDLGKVGRRAISLLLSATPDDVEAALPELEAAGLAEFQGPRLVLRDPCAPPRNVAEQVVQAEGVDLPEIKLRLLTPSERAAKEAEHRASAERWRAEQEEARNRRRITAKPHVYFIQQGETGAIKIGHTRRPVEVRQKELQNSHAEPLRLLAMAPGTQRDERALHDRFAAARLTGEWFTPVPELVAYVRLVADRRIL